MEGRGRGLGQKKGSVGCKTAFLFKSNEGEDRSGIIPCLKRQQDDFLFH